MANTAFGHDATFTTPGSTTDTALVRWANTSGTSLNNTSNILSDGSNIILNARGEVRFSDADSSHYIAFESPATVSTSYTMTLPAAVPAADNVLTVTSYSSGAGVLEWAALNITDATEASKNNMEAEATGVLYAPPDLVKHSPGVAKCWVNINQTPSSHTAMSSYNVGSINDIALGKSGVVPIVDFSSVEYTVVMATTGLGRCTYERVFTNAVDLFDISNTDEGNTQGDSGGLCAVAFGDQ